MIWTLFFVPFHSSKPCQCSKTDANEMYQKEGDTANVTQEGLDVGVRHTGFRKD